jgi:hypothetical protein
MAENTSDRIREHVEENYVTVALRTGQRRFEVRAGKVEREIGLRNRTPQVCSALRSRKFLDANNLRIVGEEGPPSGQSTRTTFTYEFREAQPAQPRPSAETAGSGGLSSAGGRAGKSVFQLLREMRGIAADVYRRLGGPDRALEDERSGFSR